MTFWKWSQTAASNSTADSTINWAEGQAPSTINDSARAMMAAAAKYRDDTAGAIVTGGNLNAYSVSSFQGFDTLAHLNGQAIAFTPHTTNGATVTLSVDGLAAKPLRPAPGVELQSGVLIQGTPYMATYNNSDGVFYLRGVGAAPGIPLGAGFDYWGTTAPTTAFALAQGQAISRATYAPLFALLGTTYGVGDGSTTFNIPDKVGRVSAMLDAGSARLSATYFGGNPANLGAFGGGESKTLLTTNLPPYTPAGANAITVTNGVNGVPQVIFSGGGTSNFAPSSSLLNGALFGPGGITITSAFTGTPQGGTSAPIRTVQPTIVCNYIIRVL